MEGSASDREPSPTQNNTKPSSFKELLSSDDNSDLEGSHLQSLHKLSQEVPKSERNSINDEFNQSEQDSNNDEINLTSDNEQRNVPEVQPTSNNPTEISNSNKKVTIASRNTQKRVIIDEISTYENVSPVNKSLDYLENRFLAGVAEVRHEVERLKTDKHILESHIKTLEQQLSRLTNERDHLYEVTHQMDQELKMTKEQCSNHAENSRVYKQHLDTITNKHEKHLNKIAHHLHTQKLAQKSVNKWRSKIFGSTKLKKSNEELENENKKLRDELMLCQEAAKKAFIRSASALNTEALSMFQDTANRRLDTNFNSAECCLSDPESMSTTSDILYTSAEQDKENVFGSDQQARPNNPQYSTNQYHFDTSLRMQKPPKITIASNSSRLKDGIKKISSNSAYSHFNTTVDTNARILHKRSNDIDITNLHKSRNKLLISDYTPQTLREESRACLQQLKNTKYKQPHNSESRQAIPTQCCTCQEFPKSDSKCYCSRFCKQTENNESSYKKPSDLKRPKHTKSVIYNPSASTIIIEKHLRK